MPRGACGERERQRGRRTARNRNDSFITPRHTHAPVVQLHVELCTLRARPVRGRVDTHRTLSLPTHVRGTRTEPEAHTQLSYSSPQAAPCRTVATKSTPNMSFHGWWASLAMARETCAHGDHSSCLSLDRLAGAGHWITARGERRRSLGQAALRSERFALGLTLALCARPPAFGGEVVGVEEMHKQQQLPRRTRSGTRQREALTRRRGLPGARGA